MWTIFCNLGHCFHKETNLGWDVFMRGSGTYKEKERQKAVLSGTMVVGLAVNCGMLPWLFMAFQRAFTCAPVTICRSEAS
jgi:hypothetical protein